MSAADLGGRDLPEALPPLSQAASFHDAVERHFYGLWFTVVYYSVASGDERFLRRGPGVRWAMEQTEPALYLRQSYYERFLYPIEQALLRNGVTTPEDLRTRRDLPFTAPTSRPAATVPQAPTAARMAEILRTSMPRVAAPDIRPAFMPGDAVRASGTGRAGHTRLPGYALGKRGRIAALRGFYNENDLFAMTGEARPMPVYGVEFDATELWGAEGTPGDTVMIDMWESYLTPLEESTDA